MMGYTFKMLKHILLVQSTDSLRPYHEGFIDFDSEIHSTTSSTVVFSAEKEPGVLHFFLNRNCATIHPSPMFYAKSSATAMKNVLL
ncbi:hypothetical protein D5086_013651 [Populus alba]|uniref:Uncharacterized protein n=1 Tax=Populus alba TaxID=43335 RepID=A0ACC4C8B6_POPAL